MYIAFPTYLYLFTREAAPLQARSGSISELVATGHEPITRYKVGTSWQ